MDLDAFERIYLLPSDSCTVLFLVKKYSICWCISDFEPTRVLHCVSCMC